MNADNRETLYSLLKLIPYAVITLIIIALIIALFYSTVFRGHTKVQEPSFDIGSIQQVQEALDEDDEGVVIINGSEYQPYCELVNQHGDSIIDQLMIGNPIAYGNPEGAIFTYFSPILNLPDGQWIASFGENGSAGVLTKENCQTLWKRTDADEVPEWLEAFRQKQLNDE